MRSTNWLISILRVVQGVACGLAFVVVSGCGEIEPMGSGDLEVEWNVAAKGCAANGVETVKLTVARDGDVFDRSEYPCETQTTRIDNVPRDEYTIQAVGVGDGGQTRFESPNHEVIVEGDGVVEFVGLQMSALPAEATVRWHFSNAQVCGSNKSRRVHVTLFGPAGYATWSEQSRCSAGEMRVRSVPPGNYDLVVRAVDEQGATTAHGTVSVTFEPGGGHDVTVEMTPRNQGE